ncbi:substrate-binding domain-containing protein [Klebsiella aerogenes]|jgi:DNA-binding LacI/PurR family transcriptional regulator|uniref:LacI family DNA-binding transcriptional regulator n=1 Tax=Klebsiella TaxID=570 RepID=UPI00050734AB|nr:LacI family DNA-binding transcriptional regulator [Klebsiella aerogenes]ATY02717.1 LacI family transcriptional regulator [Klebsiella aerogenes]EIV3800052.1 substrate-binding domain-containing protein [Klebsiella aerogenes]EIV6642948.1 substrate-binding domain-containing protein [Klebsiella aerogenes]EIV7211593.1 substrate-binding domain-containing protein [Klebsiella aerogenes]EKL0981732.1 substrate-binding domain-containing protein [Klebsiella aerogenes]
MQRRSATLEDVAREAGVSQQTVSRVVNNPQIVAQRTREKVLRAMQTLHYVPNRSAQLLAGKAAASIGLITASLTLHAPSQIAAAVKRYAGEQGLEVAIAMPAQSDYPALQARLDEFRAQHIRGAIISLPLESSVAERLAAENTDIACLFLDVSPETDVSCVRFDHRDGCGACVRHLWELGHREFGLLAGPESSVSARMRLGSWRETLHRLGVSQSITVFGDWSAASGWQKTFELLHKNPKLSAIVVANDQMALGVLSALAQLNRRGSQAISVTGYDDTADSLYFQPPLTTVAQDFDLLGRRAVELLMQQMAAPTGRLRELLPARLVVRQSTWPLAAQGNTAPLIAELKALVEKL